MTYLSDNQIETKCPLKAEQNLGNINITTMWSKMRTISTIYAEVYTLGHLNWDKPGSSLFLCEHTQYETPFTMWVERGGDDDVFTWRQFEALAHLSQVEEGVAPCNGLLTQQHIRAEMNVIATHDLQNKHRWMKWHLKTCKGFFI